MGDREGGRGAAELYFPELAQDQKARAKRMFSGTSITGILGTGHTYVLNSTSHAVRSQSAASPITV
jgi:hypothetical protein